MTDKNIGDVVRQNEAIITLIGRIAFTPNEIRDIVVKKKQNPDKYVQGYNTCDGDHTVTDIANVIGVLSTQQSSPYSKSGRG